MPSINHVFALSITGRLITGGQAALTGAPDVMSLPFVEVRTGNDLGPMWSGFDDRFVAALARTPRP
ncbi:MAG: hypothetical protein SGJ11_03500 [Phycisphaerae bacterium]|nr:hypothetical protein [Phycisphaerae bacterium]